MERILNEQGIDVTNTMQRRSGKCDGIDHEFEFIAINGTEVIIIEGETTMRKEDVIDFLDELRLQKKGVPSTKKNIRSRCIHL